MILGADKKRLSKRHGAASVEEFRDAGYLPEAVVNYLALVGWSFDDSTEIMSIDELVERFTIDRVSTSPGVFDHQKLAWMNGVTCARSIPALYAGRLRAFLRDRGSPIADRPEIDAVVPLVQEKIATLGEFEEFAGFLFHPVVYDEDAWQKVAALPRGGGDPGRAACGAGGRRRRFEPADVEAALRGMSEQLGLKPRVAFLPPRVAISGRTISPGPVRVDRAARPRGVARPAARPPAPGCSAAAGLRRGRETPFLRFPQQTATIQMPLLRDAAWGV